MVARRAPVDRLLDLAVATPVCAMSAARQAIPLVARAGALGTTQAIRRVSQAVQDLRGGDGAPVDLSESPVGEGTEMPEPVAAPTVASVSVDELPIPGYDDLAARQVVSRLADLDAADLVKIEVYEREHRSRSTVLGKIAQLTA